MCELDRYNKSKLKEMAEINGFDNIFLLTVEECSELTKAITKLKRFKSNLKNASPIEFLSLEVEDSILHHNLMEEIADVELLLSQMKILLNGEKYVNGIKVNKISRFFKRLKEGKLL